MAKKDGGVVEDAQMAVMSDDSPEIFIPAVADEVKAKPAVPEAQLVFDKTVAAEWLINASARLRGVFESVRFEPEGMPEEHIGFLLLLVGKSIMKEYTLRDRSIHKGLFFVPAELSEKKYPPSFEGLEQLDRKGNWITYGVK